VAGGSLSIEGLAGGGAVRTARAHWRKAATIICVMLTDDDAGVVTSDRRLLDVQPDMSYIVTDVAKAEEPYG